MPDSTTDLPFDPPPVPPAYRGVWSRTLLQAPGRPDDTTTFVRWMQTARWHADVRVPPRSRPAAGRSAVAGGIDPRAWQQGFSGRTMVDLSADGRERCHWLRQVDVQPPGLTLDVGYVRFESTERLIETGVHAEYYEIWDRQPGSTGPSRVLQALPAVPTGEPPTRWLMTGHHAMRVRSRAAEWPTGTAPGDTLADVLQRHPGAATALLDFEISYGPVAGDAWSITHSTLPALEGCVLPWRVTRLANDRAQVDGPDGPTLWQVLEWEDGAGLPA